MMISLSSIVFTGHMIDLPKRTSPRFPAHLEQRARAWIREKIMDVIRVNGTAVVGFASGARGGDILFHEECRALGLITTIVLPFPARVFEKGSIAGVSSGQWRVRFRKLWHDTASRQRVVLYLPQSNVAYANCNSRMIELAKNRGKFHLIALWDGKNGDGPGGTADLVAKARECTDRPDIVAPLELKYP